MASSSDEQPKPPEPPAAAVAVATTAPQSHSEWAASMQAFYASGGHPYAAWPAQLMAAAAASGTSYGAPVPFPMYHPGAAMAYYAHASMAAGVPYPTAEAVAAAAAAPVVAEGKGKAKGGGVSPEKGSSAAPSGDDASQSCESGSDESSDTRDYDTDQKDSSAPKKRKSGNTSAEGEPSQAAAVPYAAVESPYQLKGRSASKLPVSAPGRAALPNATPNLNIGIDLWSASQSLAVIPVQGEANPGLALARCDGVGQLDSSTPGYIQFQSQEEHMVVVHQHIAALAAGKECVDDEQLHTSWHPAGVEELVPPSARTSWCLTTINKESSSSVAAVDEVSAQPPALACWRVTTTNVKSAQPATPVARSSSVDTDRKSPQGRLVRMLDEREIKRERRKQSNRESARRSRLRKQELGDLNYDIAVLCQKLLYPGFPTVGIVKHIENMSSCTV
uniref:DNA-binding protein EMBP-1 n=1 Tax=Aegilops tauschii TaxID=37682 RepID=M8BQE9_AEGTA